MNRQLGFALKLSLVVLMTFCGKKTSSDELKQVDEVRLTKGQKAPYQGILTPESRWRDRKVELDVCDFNKQVYEDYYGTKDGDSADTYIWATVGGMAIGALAYYIIESAVRRDVKGDSVWLLGTQLNLP